MWDEVCGVQERTLVLKSFTPELSERQVLCFVDGIEAVGCDVFVNIFNILCCIDHLWKKISIIRTNRRL